MMAKKNLKKSGLSQNKMGLDPNRREFLKKGMIALGCLMGERCLYGDIFSLFKSSEHYGIFKNTAPEKLLKWSKEAYFYSKVGDKVRCNTCPNLCTLDINDRSICRSKVNKEHKLYSLTYGNPCAVHIDPVEKKPLFHFLPKIKVFSIATAGCNLRCLNCQNWEISQSTPEKTNNYDLMPQRLVEVALKENTAAIAYTYSEPISFYEYMYDASFAAKRKGLKNLWITNGYINEKPLTKLCEVIDGANIDLKGFDNDTYKTLNYATLEPVLATLKTLKSKNIWFEITNLVVPTYTDKLGMIKKMCQWLMNNIGPDYPLHFSRFHPMYKLVHLPPTPLKILEQARDVAMKVGLNYVYIGNVPNHPAQHTYCPACKRMVVERLGYSVKSLKIKGGRCTYCNAKIAGIWT